MAYLIKKYKLGKTSRTQRVTYPKIFFQRLRYFDANEGINPIMVDFIYKNFMISVKAKLFCPEIAGLFCRIAGLFCHDSRANLSLKPVCFGIAIS